MLALEMVAGPCFCANTSFILDVDEPFFSQRCIKMETSSPCLTSKRFDLHPAPGAILSHRVKWAGIVEVWNKKEGWGGGRGD